MRYFLLIIISVWFLGCKQNTTKVTEEEKVFKVDFEFYNVDASIRAIDVVNKKTMWFGGSNNMYGYTEDGGMTWHIDSVEFQGRNLEFRGIEVTNNAVYLSAVGSPGVVFMSEDKGQNWELVYEEGHENTFYNSLGFWDVQEGLAVGDPTDGCLSVILTADAGRNWKKVSCDKLPSTQIGEAGFAASNTNLAMYDNHVWLVSGGTAARVFHSADKGATWEVFDSPIIAGDQMTGIFSVDFYNDKEGIIVGGDWNKQSQQAQSMALTKDGGETWQLVETEMAPAFRSCVQYIPHTEGQELFAVGSLGIVYSQDGGNTWETISEEGFYTIRLANDSKTAWLAGKNRIAKMIFDQ